MTFTTAKKILKYIKSIMGDTLAKRLELKEIYQFIKTIDNWDIEYREGGIECIILKYIVKDVEIQDAIGNKRALGDFLIVWGFYLEQTTLKAYKMKWTNTEVLTEYHHSHVALCGSICFGEESNVVFEGIRRMTLEKVIDLYYTIESILFYESTYTDPYIKLSSVKSTDKKTLNMLYQIPKHSFSIFIKQRFKIKGFVNNKIRLVSTPKHEIRGRLAKHKSFRLEINGSQPYYGAIESKYKHVTFKNKPILTFDKDSEIINRIKECDEYLEPHLTKLFYAWCYTNRSLS